MLQFRASASKSLWSTSCIFLQAQLGDMDSKSLQEEYQALLSDKAGEAEYLHSLQLQIAKLMVLRNIHSLLHFDMSFNLWCQCSILKRFKISQIDGVKLSIYFSIWLTISSFLLSDNFPQYQMFLWKWVQDRHESLWMKMTRARQVLQLASGGVSSLLVRYVCK